MAEHEAVPTNVRFLDALDRAWRTLYSLVGVDVLLLLGNGLTQLLNDNDPMGGQFWWLLLVLVIKTLLGAVASFLLRYARQPKVTGTEVTPVPLPIVDERRG